MIKIDKHYDLNKIKKEIDILLSEHTLTLGAQLLLQSPNGDDWYNITAPSKIHPDLRETDYKKLNIPEDWESAKFIKENNLCRTRLLVIPTGKCYSWHKDYGHRMHLAVHTNEKCFFVEDRTLVNIPDDGFPYLLDVSNWHTAMNCSDGPFDRIHLVGVVR